MTDPIDWLMDVIGYVPKEHLADAQRNVQQLEAASSKDAAAIADLRKKVEHLRGQKVTAEHALDQAKLEGRRRVWQEQDLADFQSSPSVPEALQKRTLLGAQAFTRPVKSLRELCDPAAFITEEARVLYWSIAHATKAVQAAHRRLKDEDEISGEFLSALLAQIENQAVTGGSSTLVVGAHEIFNNVDVALKEKIVGADMLLAVSGDTLVHGGGVRLFWIQAKRGTTDAPFMLNIYRDPNADDFTQFEALTYVHQPALGSISLYANYVRNLRCVLAASVCKLAHVNSRVRAQCQLPLEQFGVRLQELVVANATTSQLGSFETAEALIDFLERATANAIIPLEVVAVQGGHELIPNLMIGVVQKYYDALLETYLNHESPGQSHEDEPERDRGPEMDF